MTARSDDDAAVLVLDDYHVISSPLVHESVGFLLEHRPPGLSLVLASRSEPPLALALSRLRAGGQLASCGLQICGSRPRKRRRCYGR